MLASVLHPAVSLNDNVDVCLVSAVIKKKQHTPTVMTTPDHYVQAGLQVVLEKQIQTLAHLCI